MTARNDPQAAPMVPQPQRPSMTPAPAMSSSQVRQGLARGSALGFIGAALSAILGFALTIVLTRLLGSAGAGIVMQATGVFGIVLALAKCGLDSTALYLLPRLKADDPLQLRPMIHLMSVVVLVAGVLGGLLLYLSVPYIWRDADPDLQAGIRAVAVFIPVGSGALVAAAMMRALGGMKAYVLIHNIALPALRPPAVALAAVAGASLAVVSAAWAVPLLLTVGASAFVVRWHLRRLEGMGGRDRFDEADPVSFFPSSERRRALASFAFPRTLSAALEQMLVSVDIVIIGALLGPGAAGIYGGASRFIQAGMIVDSALRLVVAPRFSALLHTGKRGELEDIHHTATTWLVLFASPIYLLMALFSPVFMSVLGPDFVEGAIVLTLLSVGAIIAFLAGNIHSLLIMSGRSGWAAANKVIVVSVNILGNVLLIPAYGIVAAACVWAACMVLDAFLAAIEVRIFVGIPIPVVAALLPLLLNLVVVGLPSALIVGVVGRDLGAFMVAICVSMVTFFAACVILRERLCLSGLFLMKNRQK